MTAKEQIIKNLSIKPDFTIYSRIEYNFYGIQHTCYIEFPPDSWALARKQGYTFNDVVDKTQNKTFDFLMWILTFDFDETNHNFFINNLVLSSLWRPTTDGKSPHEDGRGIDFIKITPNIGGEIVCNSTTKNESAFLVKLRKSAMSAGLITQYFSPWTMYYYDNTGKIIEVPNNGITANEKIHLTHVHFTIAK